MAGAFKKLASMALSEDEQYDWLQRRYGSVRPSDGVDDPPDYPDGLCFTVREADFEALGIGQVKPGEMVRFAAFARCTSCNLRMDGCRIEAEFEMLALGDGKMVDLDEGMRPSICLDENDHDRLDLDEPVEMGDMLHLIGMAQVKSTDDNQWGGKCVSLQIVEASVENEDLEEEAA